MTTLSQIQRAMDRAVSYEEWQAAARAHDRKTGMERWKAVDQSRRYDFVSIRVRLDRLRALSIEGDNRGLLFCLNEGIHVNLGGMGSSALYG